MHFFPAYDFTGFMSPLTVPAYELCRLYGLVQVLVVEYQATTYVDTRPIVGMSMRSSVNTSVLFSSM